MLHRETHHVTTPDGWTLELTQSLPAQPSPGQPPVLFVPGYGMNDFILRFHPTGTSMIGYLVEQGLEVWSANLRGQGQSRGPAGAFGLRELSLVDLPACIAHVRQQTGATQVDLVGCSLGATMVYSYLAHHTDCAFVRRVIAIGGPLRWETVHPLLKTVFRSSRLAGAVPIRGTRKMARAVLPVARRIPPLLLIYATPWRIDLSQVNQLVQTIENPVPQINAEMARWFRSKDLIVDGVNVTEALGDVERPVLCVLGNQDGIVPPQTALAVCDAMPGRVEVLAVGDRSARYAHADLFISDTAEADVFTPMGAWLLKKS